MLLKILLAGAVLYHFCWTGNILFGLLGLILLSQFEIMDKLESFKKVK